MDFPELNSSKTITANEVPENNFSKGLIMESTGDSMNKSLTIDMQFNGGHVVSITVYSVLFILSAGGNITVLTAILRRKKPRAPVSRIDYLLVHLAVADLMVTFFMMPLEIGWAATVYWTAGDFMCRIMSFFRIFGLYLSGFILVCLAIDRYLAVRFPMQSLASNRRAKLMVLAAWVLSCACSFPQILIFHLESHPDFPWYTQCVTFNSFSEKKYDILYQLFGMVMMYALPFILLVVLYGSIALELYKMSRSTLGAFGSPDGLRRSGVDNIERAKVKSIQMTFVITAAFLVCWTPYYVMCVWYMADEASAQKVDQRIQKGLFLFACTNSTVNPIVYGIFHMKSIFGRNRMQSRELTIRSNSTPVCRTQLLCGENSPGSMENNGQSENTQKTREIYKHHHRCNNSELCHHGENRESVRRITHQNHYGNLVLENDKRRDEKRAVRVPHSRIYSDSTC